MTALRAGRSQGGYTILEVLIASVILLIGMLGFAATSATAALSSGSAMSRTSMVAIRGALVDRLVVTPRSSFAAMPTSWAIDGCYDGHSQLLATNVGWSSTYTCPTGTSFRTWLQVTANGTASWTVQTYVERTATGCAAADRASSFGCLATDLLLTD